MGSFRIIFSFQRGRKRWLLLAFFPPLELQTLFCHRCFSTLFLIVFFQFSLLFFFFFAFPHLRLKQNKTRLLPEDEARRRPFPASFRANAHPCRSRGRVPTLSSSCPHDPFPHYSPLQPILGQQGAEVRNSEAEALIPIRGMVAEPHPIHPCSTPMPQESMCPAAPRGSVTRARL